MIFKYLSELT